MKKILSVLLFSLTIVISAHAEIYDVVDTELPPLMYSENGEPQGFYVDILRSMLQNLKDTDIKIQFYPAPRMFNNLSKNSNTFSLGILVCFQQKYCGLCHTEIPGIS